jgi:hypothetical protein
MTRRELLITVALTATSCRTEPQSSIVTLTIAGMI